MERRERDAVLGVIGVVITALLSKMPAKQAEDQGVVRDPLGVLMIPLRDDSRPRRQ
jgi:hypothetical protein